MTAALVALALSCGAAHGGTPPEPASVQYAEGRQLCTLANPAIRESSGIACSRRSPDVFWTHNDSGDAPRLFAFNSKGEDLGTFRVAGARAEDWEDMASFQKDGKSYLLVGDVGDNKCARAKCTIYLVPEPRVDPKRRGVEGATEPALAIDFRYEEGPRNCESIAIDPTTATVYLVEKALVPECRVYALPLRGGIDGRVLVAKAVATLRVPVTSAMDISPDGLRAIVLTYGDACEYSRRPGEKWSDAFGRTPRVIRMPPRRQGESVCYGPDGKTLYLTSEGAPAPLFTVPAVGAK